MFYNAFLIFLNEFSCLAVLMIIISDHFCSIVEKCENTISLCTKQNFAPIDALIIFYVGYLPGKSRSSIFFPASVLFTA